MIRPSTAAWILVGWSAVGCGGGPPRPSTHAAGESMGTFPARVAGEPRVGILGGHLRMPQMGDVREAEGQSEVILEAGPEAGGLPDFVMRAVEHHARSTGDVLEDARRMSLDRTRVEVGPVVRGLRVAWTYDETQWNGSVPIPLLAPVLVHPDGTVQRLAFHLAPRLASEREAYLARARAIVERMEPGEPLPVGPAAIEVEGGITIDVPAGYAHLRHEPMDDQVAVRIYHLRRVGEPAGILLVHAGRAHRLPDPPGSTRAPGTLLGRSVEWTSTVGPESRTLRSVVRLAERQLTITAISPDEATELALRGIAETMRAP
jgi:hypothetical protein